MVIPRVVLLVLGCCGVLVFATMIYLRLTMTAHTTVVVPRQQPSADAYRSFVTPQPVPLAGYRTW